MHKKYLLILFLMLLLNNSTVFAQKFDENLRQKLQSKLDEWHQSGKFAGATIGVCLADGNCSV